MSLKSDFHIELRHSAVIMIIYNDIQTKIQHKSFFAGLPKVRRLLRSNRDLGIL